MENNELEHRVSEGDTSHLQSKEFLPRMTEMMDKLSIGGRQVGEETKLEPKDQGTSMMLTPPSDDWMRKINECFYSCEFCGHRPPHEKLAILHAHGHLDYNRMQVRRQMYARLDTLCQMLSDMGTTSSDGNQTAAPYIQTQAGGKMRTKHNYSNRYRSLYQQD